MNFIAFILREKKIVDYVFTLTQIYIYRYVSCNGHTIINNINNYYFIDSINL